MEDALLLVAPSSDGSVHRQDERDAQLVRERDALAKELEDVRRQVEDMAAAQTALTQRCALTRRWRRLQPHARARSLAGCAPLLAGNGFP